jgi:hypothetical protein
MMTLLLRLARLVAIASLANSMPSDGIRHRCLTSDVDLRGTLNVADTVVVARFTDLGFGDEFGPGRTDFNSASFEVQQEIRGHLPVRFQCSLSVQLHLDTNSVDTLPVVGESYIVIGNSQGRTVALQKLLHATPDNLVVVKTALGEAPPITARPQTSDQRASRALETANLGGHQLFDASPREPRRGSLIIVAIFTVFGVAGAFYWVSRSRKADPPGRRGI